MTKPILIVGGGNGVGLAIVKALVVQKKNVCIADVAFSGDAIALTTEETRYQINLASDNLESISHLDIGGLIITAGIGRLDFFESFTSEEIEKTFRINTLSAIQLIRSYYPRIQAQEDFPVAVIVSITGRIASPLYALYSATKGALVKFIEATNAELAYHGISNRILEVSPGKIKGTLFHGNENATNADVQELNHIAATIIEKVSAHEELYIPHYEDVYAGVLKRYADDPGGFAQQSLSYKIKNSTLNPKPQIKIGYLTGSWDLFHIGHLNVLNNARKYCDKLVVGVHKDGSHKGKQLFISLEERMAILRAIRIVDDVIVSSGEDMNDWERVKFDYLFVGSDYKGTERFNRYEELAKSLGVKIVYLPYTKTTSSTQLRSVISYEVAKGR